MSEARTWNSDIKQIGDSIVKLTLLQAKELADYLKDEDTMVSIISLLSLLMYQ